MQVAPVLNHSNSLSNGPLFIPANSTRTFFSSAYVPVDFTLTGINPHMHLLGKSIKAYGVKPDGDTIHLIDIPDWHFHWQGFYNFPKPLLLPAGTILKGEAVYDNTISNPYNPNSPPQNVSAGEGTSDEMMMIFFIFAPFQPGDTSIVVDEGQHWPHNFEACNTFTIVPESYSGKEELHIAPHSELVYWEIRSADGRLLRKSTPESNPQPFPVEAGLPPGIYFQTRHYASGRVYYQRLCIP